jgi:hypothetical protein
MKSKELIKSICLVIIASLINLSVIAQDTVVEVDPEAVVQEPIAEEKKEVKTLVSGDHNLGKQYFEGSKPFLNRGPACISCHNVTNDELYPGGLFAKDLTDVYDRMGEGITAWLGAPPFPAMIASYQNHELTELERTSLTAFLKNANEVKDTQKKISGTSVFLIGGIGGLIAILILVSLLWMKRKKQMVKKDIFQRQTPAWDAKH